MLANVCVLAFATVLIGTWLKWVSVKGYWGKRGIKHAAPHPVWGSLTFLMKENPVEWFRKQYCIFAPKAPYFGIWVFWRPAVVVCSPDLAKNILVKDSDYFRNHFPQSGPSDKIGSLNIFILNDPTWTSVRRRLTPVFTASKLRALQPLVRRKVNELLQRIKQETGKSSLIDIRDIYTDMTTDIIGTASLGIDSDSTLTGDSSIRRITRDFQQYTLWRALSWCFIFFCPELASFLRMTMFPSAAVAYFRRVFYAVLQQRGDACENKDLMDALLRIRKELEIEGEQGLRKYPAMGWLDRVASRSYKVDDHLTIEKGTPVYVSAAGFHYDPQYFPEPLKFDPERFMPQNEGDIQSSTYLPFGDGPRVCIGQRFAQQTMRITIATLILNFYLRHHPDAPEPSDVKLEKRRMFLAPGDKMFIKFVPRNLTIS